MPLRIGEVPPGLKPHLPRFRRRPQRLRRGRRDAAALLKVMSKSRQVSTMIISLLSQLCVYFPYHSSSTYQVPGQNVLSNQMNVSFCTQSPTELSCCRVQSICHGNNQLLAKLLPTADRISFRCLPQKSSGIVERSLANFCWAHLHLNGQKTPRWLKIYQQDIRMTGLLFEVVSLD